MTRRRLLTGLILAALTPAAARAQGVEIDHKAVGCIVVGKYPKMNACFTPTSNLARGRIYFRPEGTPSWYYVDMKSDQPCYLGILPKPGKKLVGKKVEYYVDAQDKTFNSARTAEFAPVVVRSAQECKKDVPVAPFLNAANVAVFPAVPAGFAAGGALGTGAILGIVGAGAAAAGTAVVVANNNSSNPTTTVAVSSVTTTTVVVTTTTTTTTSTTTTTPATNHAPTAILSTNPDPPKGQTPLTVIFDLCKSTDPDGDPLSYFFDFGDGAKTQGTCQVSHTYAATFRARSVGKLDSSYSAQGCVADPFGASQCRTRSVDVTVPKPTVTLTLTKTSDPSQGAVSDDKGQINCDFSCTSATATYPAGTTVTLTASGEFFYIHWTWSGNPPISCAGWPNAMCSITLTQDQDVTVDFQNTGFRAGVTAGSVRWSSELKATNTDLQVIANGKTRLGVGQGATSGLIDLAPAENRVEATVVSGSGQAGTWRFDLGAEGIKPGTLRVTSGEVALVTDSEIVFRLKGTAGERIVFTFQSP